MSNDAFDDRRRALEEEFFKHHQDELLQKLKATAQKVAAREEIQALTGIANDGILNSLSDLKVDGQAALLVMSLYPVVAVAWADGKIDAAERKVILSLATSLGVGVQSPASLYLTKWLDEKPEMTWHSLWAGYVGALVAKMKPEDKAMLKNTVLGRARVVAEASGGFLGVAWRVSEAEKAVLDTLEMAFG